MKKKYRNENLRMHTAVKYGEMKISHDAGTSYLDGFMQIGKQKNGYQFHGCFFHGCNLKCPKTERHD